ncbi:hypothetical protein BX600DRAFT_498408 [Xylariales sp. PMI_506]|nr:hypothetical protein BX600DRAFT_498408 [Xylariales sp. PMI_506]
MWYLGSTPIVAENYALVFTSFFFVTLALVVVGLRVYTRGFILRRMGTDDYFMVVAMLGSISFLTSAMYRKYPPTNAAVVILTMTEIRFGLGDAVNESQLISFLQALYATVVSYVTTQLVLKYSLLFQYRRIFQTQDAKKIFTVLFVIITAYALFAEGASIITCWPVAKYWDDSIPGGCIDRSILHYVLAGFNIAIDITLLLIPILYLKKLQVTFRAKLVLIGCFACGGVACIIAIIRLQSLYVNNSAPIDQQPLYGVAIAIWSHLELNIAIVCASVPSLKPLFVKVFPKLGSLHSSGKLGYYRQSESRLKSGSRPLQSVDRTEHNHFSAADKGRMAIKVDHIIEMKTLNVTEDSGSENNLVMNAHATECYALDTQRNPVLQKTSSRFST